MRDVLKLIAFINTWLCKVQETKNFVEDCLENTWYKIERMSLYNFMIWSTQSLPKMIINWCFDVDFIGLRIVSLLHYVARYLRERVLTGLAFGTAAASVTLKVEQAVFLFLFKLSITFLMSGLCIMRRLLLSWSKSLEKSIASLVARWLMRMVTFHDHKVESFWFFNCRFNASKKELHRNRNINGYYFPTTKFWKFSNCIKRS